MKSSCQINLLSSSYFEAFCVCFLNDPSTKKCVFSISNYNLDFSCAEWKIHFHQLVVDSVLLFFFFILKQNFNHGCMPFSLCAVLHRLCRPTVYEWVKISEWSKCLIGYSCYTFYGHLSLSILNEDNRTKWKFLSRFPTATADDYASKRDNKFYVYKTFPMTIVFNPIFNSLNSF